MKIAVVKLNLLKKLGHMSPSKLLATEAADRLVREERLLKLAKVRTRNARKAKAEADAARDALIASGELTIIRGGPDGT